MSNQDLAPRRRRFEPISWWDEMHPFASFRHKLDRAFDTFFSDMGRPVGWSGQVTPSVDLLETDKAIEVTADLPGVDISELKVEIQDNVLSIQGQRKSETSDADQAVHSSERSFGSFHRLVRIPVEIEEDETKAQFANGVLKVSLPKSKAARNRARVIEIAAS